MNIRRKYSDIVGIVLAGGNSSRMGQDKKNLSLNGRPQFQHLHNMMEQVFESVFISLSSTEAIGDQHKIIRDQYDFQGPLNGILSSLSANPDSAILCVAVDMPNISIESIQTLLKHRDRTYAATCYLNKNINLLEPLFSIWEPASRNLIQTFISQKIYSPYKILSHDSVKKVETFDSKIFENLNSPTDLKNFHQENS